jgi:DNA-binding NarL/FixJ family response regulator
MGRDGAKQIRVVLAEDHTIVREGLRALLSAREDIQVVGEAGDGRQAVELCRREAPDVAIMDLSMPQLNGVDACRQIRKLCPQTKVLVLSMHSGEEYVRAAIRAGASGFLVKGSGLSDLILATRAVAAGEAFLCPAAAKVALQDACRTGGSPPEAGSELSDREREILQLVAEGRSSREISSLLHISQKTVEGHRGRIMAKLGIHDVAGLVRYAVHIGLVGPEQ